MEAFKNWVSIRKYTASKPDELKLESPSQEQKIQRAVMLLSELMSKSIDGTDDHDTVMLDDRKNRGQSISPRQLSATASACVLH